MPPGASVRLEASVSPQRTDRRSIYGGLAISLLGIAVLALTMWLLDFDLAVQLAGVVVGSALVYGGWRVTERGG
jgi:hypothetical protein